MTMRYTFRRATTDDLSAIVELLTERAEWLAGRGVEQWTEKDPTRATRETIDAGWTWVLVDDVTLRVVGTLTMTTAADRDFWTEDEAAQPALYLSKLATATYLAGLGLGRVLIDAAARYGARRGVSLLRWDVWRTNHGLQDYYRQLGATHLRTELKSGRNSGALFEWHGGWNGTLSTLRMDDPKVDVAIVASLRKDHPTIMGQAGWDPEGGQGAPSHTHILTGVGEPGRAPLEVTDTSTARRVLHHDGQVWRLNGHQVDGAGMILLTPGLLYHLWHVGAGRDCRVVATGDQLVSALQGA